MSQTSQSASLSVRQSFDLSACSGVAICNSSHESLFPSSEHRELIRLQWETVWHVDTSYGLSLCFSITEKTFFFSGGWFACFWGNYVRLRIRGVEEPQNGKRIILNWNGSTQLIDYSLCYEPNWTIAMYIEHAGIHLFRSHSKHTNAHTHTHTQTCADNVQFVMLR